MAKFTSTLGLMAFNVAGKVFKATKEGVFDLTADEENAIRAAGHELFVVVEEVAKKGADATAPAAPPAPQPPAPAPKATKADPKPADAPTAPPAEPEAPAGDGAAEK